MSRAKLTFTDNEAISLMHRNAADGLRRIADHVEKHKYPAEYIIELLREIADEQDAQAVVVDLRDKI